MVNKYKNLQQLVLIQKQHKLLRTSIKEILYNNKIIIYKPLTYNNKIIIYKPLTSNVIAYDSKKDTFIFHHEKI
jgi:hypothetical protein